MSAYSGSDEEFRRKIGTYDDFVSSISRKNPLRDLIGLKQFPTHGGLDPLEHTYYVLLILKTDDLEVSIKEISRSEAEIIRVAVKYHDVGKVKGPYNLRHGLKSAPIAKEVLSYPHLFGEEQFSNEEIALITKLIKTHDVLGRLSQRLITTKTAIKALSPPEELDISTEDLLDVHYQIIMADIASIPGLKGMVKQIDATYKTLKQEIDSN
ncbi:MAG: hypothetical protein SVY15_07005 [Halobacteriota archaeon]|nr:hypothetical protein [Halobacteriota archaeon]